MRKIAFAFVAIILMAGGVFGHAQITTSQVKLQLGFLVDGSGSISASDFATVRNAISRALTDATLTPQDGSVEVVVVQFGDQRAVTVVPATVVTASSASEIASRVEGMSQIGGGTPLWVGIDQISDDMQASPNFSVAERRTINIATDGQPQIPVIGVGTGAGTTLSLEARDRAVNAGIDEFDAEGVGQATTDTSFQNFLLDLVWEQPGVLISSGTGNLNQVMDSRNGFVILVRDFADFEAAVRDKIEAILGSAGLNGNGGGNGGGGNGNGDPGLGPGVGPGGKPIPFETPAGALVLSGLFGIILVALRFRDTALARK